MTLDLVLLGACAVVAWAGYRQGFVVGVLGFTGFLAGGFAGMLVAPAVLSGWDPLLQVGAAMALVLALATLGQVLAGLLGTAVRARLRWTPVRLLDAAAGGALAVVAVLVVSWFLALALRQSAAEALSHQVRDSQVLTGVDEVMPDRARGLFRGFRSMLDESGIQQAFGTLAAERILAVPPPEGVPLRARAVTDAGRSVVQVSGAAVACDRSVEGSGFVFAPERVMTNAHVVAGVRKPFVRVAGELRFYEARTVVYDPLADVAVLAVPGLAAPPLRFDPGIGRGDEAVVAGFPAGGPYRLDAARVRERIEARGPDVYGREQVTRDVLSLFSVVQPGNSGGPLLDADGEVAGVVFAKSIDDETTGYALTVEQVSEAAEAGRRSPGDVPVATGGCTPY